MAAGRGCGLFSLALAVSALLPPVEAAEHRCPQGQSVCCCFRDLRHAGWKALESRRFRIHFSGDREAAVALVTVCEETCEELRDRWIAGPHSDWSCKCDVYLYPDARSFERGARAPAEIWGVTDLEIGNGNVWLRRLHLRTDHREKLRAVLTHELTHVVLAEHFCRKPIPKWADEGIAVYSEPPERRERLRTFLRDEASQKRLLPLKQVAAMREGPQNERESELFYGQSGSVIEFLVQEHQFSEMQVLEFVGACNDHGWESAIRKTLPGTTASHFESNWKTWLQKPAPDARRVALREKS